MSTRSLFLASLFAFVVPACAGQTGTDSADDDAALSGGGTTYYVIRNDNRKCASPTCGGQFVKRVNFEATTCVDGSSSAECYVASVDWSKSKLSSEEISALAGQPLVVKGSIAKQKYGKSTFGNLVVSEVWSGVNGAIDGMGYAKVGSVVYRVKDTGVRCITWPCPSEHETKLNGTSSRDIAGVDLQSVGATDDQISAAYEAMTGPDGVFVDGVNSPITGPGGTMQQLTASNFFAKVVHIALAGESCGGIGGFQCANPTMFCDANQVNACTTADLLGTCKITYLLCANIYQPVCGCDNATYSNDCERIRAKVQKAHDGACAAN
jgi:hypothetical protein